MAKLDDLIEELSEQGRDEDVAELEQLRGSKLRKQAGKAAELEARVKELEGVLAEKEAAPAREKALKDYGVDVDNLSKAEAAVLSSLKGELTAEQIAELVEKYDLPVTQGSGQTTEEPPAAQRVAQQAAGAPGGRPGGAAITPADVASWPIDRTRRFMDEHPEAYDALLRGETVTGVTE